MRWEWKAKKKKKAHNLVGFKLKSSWVSAAEACARPLSYNRCPQIKLIEIFFRALSGIKSFIADKRYRAKKSLKHFNDEVRCVKTRLIVYAKRVRDLVGENCSCCSQWQSQDETSYYIIRAIYFVVEPPSVAGMALKLATYVAECLMTKCFKIWGLDLNPWGQGF